MAWALKDCDRPLRIGEKREHYGCVMREDAEEEMRKKAEE